MDIDEQRAPEPCATDRVEEGLLALTAAGGMSRGWLQELAVVQHLDQYGVFEGVQDHASTDLFATYVKRKRRGFDHLGLERQGRRFRPDPGGERKRRVWWRIDKAEGLHTREEAHDLEAFLIDNSSGGTSRRLARTRAAIKFYSGEPLTESENNHKEGFVTHEIPHLREFSLIEMGEDNALFLNEKSLITSGKDKDDAANAAMHSFMGLINRGMIVLPGVDAQPHLEPLEFDCPPLEMEIDCTAKASSSSSKAAPPPKKAKKGAQAKPPPQPPERQRYLKERTDKGWRTSMQFRLFVGAAAGRYASANSIFPLYQQSLRTEGITIADPPRDEKSLRHTIGKIGRAYGVLAMAYTGANLIKKGELGKLFSIMVDGGTMKAGRKVQGAVTSECTGTSEDGNPQFRRDWLGAIPVQNGTNQHAVERLFELFADIVEAVVELAPMLGWIDYSSEQLESLGLSDLFAGVREVLGDHGEIGVMNATAEKIDALFEEEEEEEEKREFDSLNKVFCFMHKGINLYGGAETGMVEAEPAGHPERDEDDEAELAMQAEEFGDSQARRKGQSLSAHIIRECCKLFGKHSHESLNKGKAFAALWNQQGRTALHWESVQNARGLQADFANAAPTLRLMVASLQTEGKGGGIQLINGLAAKQKKYGKNKANRLHQSIFDAYEAAKGNDLTAICQMGAKTVLHVCLLAPYRALANSRSQAQLIEVSFPLRSSFCASAPLTRSLSR